jgi:hypothetical protein
MTDKNTEEEKTSATGPSKFAKLRGNRKFRLWFIGIRLETV